MMSTAGAIYDEQAIEYLERWFFNPVRFAYDVFGIEAWERQEEMLTAPLESDHFAFKTGHKTGKSTSIAIAALWWALTRENARVPITSSSYLQVKKIIWREIKRLYREARVPLGGKLHDDPRTGLIFDNGNEIFGFSTSEKERAAGFSGPNQLFLIDEASGGSLEEVFDAIEGNIAGGGIIGMFGNPTRTTGPFFDAFRQKSSIWRTGTISSEETPNAVSGRVIVPGLATAHWIAQRKTEWGEEHPLYQIRVAGNFPKYSDSSIIPYFLLDSAQLAWRAQKYRESGEERRHEYDMIKIDEGPVRMGLDVGRHGQDDSVLQVVRGLIALTPKNFHGLDGVELATEALDECERMRESGYFHVEKVPIILKVDEIGVGTSPYDHLKHSQRARALNVEVVPVNTARSPVDANKYADANTELLFTLRRWLEAGGMLPEHERLEKEILFPEFFIDEKERFARVYKKKDERKPENIGHSPDNRDALCLALMPARLPVREHISDGERETARAADRFSREALTEKSSLEQGLRGGSANSYIKDGDGWMRSFSG